MQVVGVRVEDIENRVKRKTMIRCDDPRKATSRKEKKKTLSYSAINCDFSR